MVLSFPVLHTDENVAIENADSLNPCECGRNLTLTCKLKKNMFAVEWLNKNDTTPIAQSVDSSCDLNSDYIGHFKFTCDIRQAIYNLTILDVTMTDNRKTLICSDGSDSDTKVLTVKDLEPIVIENTKNGNVEVRSGCISNGTNVSLKWRKISVSSKLEEEFFPTIQKAYTTSCSNIPKCGQYRHVQYTEIYPAKPSDNGKYYLKIVAVYGNESKESFTTSIKYIIEEPDNGSSNVTIAVVCLVGLSFLFTMILVVFTAYRMKKKIIYKEVTDIYKGVRIF